MKDLKKCFVGIEFGSTRIKSVMIDENGNPLSSGSYVWENKLENGIWTYSYDEMIRGMQACYKALKKDFFVKTGASLTEVGGIGISGMMHGYIPLDKSGNPLVPFRTWRNNCAESAAAELTELFSYPVPARWSIAHLYNAIRNEEIHVQDIEHIVTLSVYIHFLLTGKILAGIGEASGMFPIDPEIKNYNAEMMSKFEHRVHNKFNRSIKSVLPNVFIAGQHAGTLTREGALLLDPSGDLNEGIPLCPPEGDAGTGMVATNSVKAGTGNVSAGTSVFSMAVLKKPLRRVHNGIDIVTTPYGDEVAMVHCNNCSSEIDAWVKIFGDFAKMIGKKINTGELYDKLFENSVTGDADCGKTVSCNYLSGENLTGISSGVPLIMHSAKGKFDLQNFVRSLLYSAFVTLKLGMDELIREEKIDIGKIYAHGGIFKTEGVCQQYLADALNIPVAVMETAGEGGAWGMAVLASYLGSSLSLSEYLAKRIFVGQAEKIYKPIAQGVTGFEEYAENFNKLLKAEQILSDIQ